MSTATPYDISPPPISAAAPPPSPPPPIGAVTEELLAQLTVQHGRVAKVSSKARTTRRGVEIKPGADWECVFRKPTPSEYKAFRADSVNPQRAPDSQEILARKTVVHPNRMEFDRLLDEFPGIPAAAGWSLKKLCGLTVEEFPELSKSRVSEDDLDNWESKYRFIKHVMGEGGAWECVFRIPTRLELKAFRGRAHDAKIQSEAIETLARQCCLYPPKDAFTALLEDYPGIPEASVNAFMELAQVESDEEGKH